MQPNTHKYTFTHSLLCISKKGTQLYHMCVYDINGKARNNMYDVIYYCNKIGDLKAQTMKSYNITSSYTLLLFVHLNIEL